MMPMQTKGIVFNAVSRRFWLPAGEGMTADIAAAHIYEYGDVARDVRGNSNLQFWPMRGDI